MGGGSRINLCATSHTTKMVHSVPVLCTSANPSVTITRLVCDSAIHRSSRVKTPNSTSLSYHNPTQTHVIINFLNPAHVKSSQLHKSLAHLNYDNHIHRCTSFLLTPSATGILPAMQWVSNVT